MLEGCRKVEGKLRCSKVRARGQYVGRMSESGWKAVVFESEGPGPAFVLLRSTSLGWEVKGERVVKGGGLLALDTRRPGWAAAAGKGFLGNDSVLRRLSSADKVAKR